MNSADLAFTDDDLRRLFDSLPRRRDVLGLYLDASVNMLVADLLTEQDVLFTDAYSQGQGGEKSDIRVLAKAAELGLILVTYDRDFREVHARLSVVKELQHSGILIIASDTLKRDENQLAGALSRIVGKYEGSSELFWNQILPL